MLPSVLKDKLPFSFKTSSPPLLRLLFCAAQTLSIFKK